VATPLLTVYSDQYVRSYTRIRRGRRDFPDENIHLLVMCPQCRNVQTHGLDEYIDRPSHCQCDVTPLVAGPMWAGPIHSVQFVEEMRNHSEQLGTSSLRRIERYLSLFLSEDRLPPYHYDTHAAADLADARTPSLDRIMDRLRSAGYEVCRTHFAPTALKTDAPYQAFLEALT
jgi:tRNA (guanine26-N2/guanine27-N2)-dimethyltransferase